MDGSEHISLFAEKKPFASSTVWACVVYSLVPFIGVLFVPFIFVIGVAGIARGERAAIRAMVTGTVILMVQLVLWWLLYAVPKWDMAN